MNTSLAHLPQQKQDEINKFVQIIKDKASVEMVILFGSHARGDKENKEWTQHKYVKEDTVYEYSSDFDILVIVRKQQMEEDFGLWDEIENEAYKQGVKTWISLIVDNIHYVNEQLELGRYFYSDIKKEGVVLYDSEKFHLSAARKLSSEEQKELAQKDFDYWFESAEHFFDNFSINLEKDRLNNAAFNLHQSTERLFATLLLVFTGYRPKTHDIKRLLDKVAEEIDSKIINIFHPGLNDEEEKNLFELLRKAYVDARYEKSYEITKEQLTKLGSLTEKLKETTKNLCEKHISTL